MKNLVDIVANATEYLATARDNNCISKADVCDAMHMRLSIIMSKLVSYPVCTQFALPLDPGPSDIDNDNEALHEFFTRDHGTET